MSILELAQTQNFNWAAENLFISQPTMTYQINAAENEIGFRIFERSGKGASLTPAGAQFVTTLRTIREELKTAIEQGQNFSAKYKEMPHLGAIETAAVSADKLRRENTDTAVSSSVFRAPCNLRLYQFNLIWYPGAIYSNIAFRRQDIGSSITLRRYFTHMMR